MKALAYEAFYKRIYLKPGIFHERSTSWHSSIWDILKYSRAVSSSVASLLTVVYLGHYLGSKMKLFAEIISGWLKRKLKEPSSSL